uniref:Uncharacterized protein n=1 Tax=Heliothis virescens TaxID=7102 RepID=A0A2A4K585_HELVI
MTDYERIKQTCLEKAELWEDPDFPASQSSVFYYQTPPFHFEWKRSKEIYQNPSFIHDRNEVFDVIPGKLDQTVMDNQEQFVLDNQDQELAATLEEMDTNIIQEFQEDNNNETLIEITANMSKLNVNALVFVPSSDAQQLEAYECTPQYQQFIAACLNMPLDLHGNPYIYCEGYIESMEGNYYGEIAASGPLAEPPPLPPPNGNTEYEMIAMETDMLYPSIYIGPNSPTLNDNFAGSQEPPLLQAIYGPSTSTAFFYEPPKPAAVLYIQDNPSTSYCSEYQEFAVAVASGLGGQEIASYLPKNDNEIKSTPFGSNIEQLTEQSNQEGLYMGGYQQAPPLPPISLEDIPMPTAPKPSGYTPILSISKPVSTDHNWDLPSTSNTHQQEMNHDKPNKTEMEIQEECEVPKKINKKRQARNIDTCSNKEHVSLVLIGHVDAGKSTIGGQIMSLTGMVDRRTLDKYEKEAREKSRESWYLSWALDTNQEERDRGKTVEVGRAYFETEKKHFTILDAPGHKSFVPNMIGGAAQADCAVLVISARKGEFETGFDRGGQTREHAMLAKSSGVKHLIAVVNKMDDPTVNWDEKRYNECHDKILPYLKKLGFTPGKDLYFLPVSGQTGQGLLERVSEDVCKWYRGPSFIQLLDELPSINRKTDGPFIMPVADKFKDMGTVLMGKVEAGVTRVGNALLLMPNKVQVIVDQMWSDDQEVTTVAPGENVKIKVKGIEEEEISTGFVLCDINNPVPIVKVFDAQVVVLEHKSIICAGYSAVMHIHCAHEEVTVKSLICLVDKKTGDKWMVSCLGVLYLTKGLFYRVVPADQRVDEAYAGVFRFRLWWCGQWLEVLVDDRLPTVNGKLAFLQSNHTEQMWPALLEKAYAKLHGSYEALKYGSLLDGLADLTGGITESLQMTELTDAETLRNLLKNTSLVTAHHVAAAPEDKIPELQSEMNYVVLNVEQVESTKGPVHVVRVLRPLGIGEVPVPYIVLNPES